MPTWSAYLLHGEVELAESLICMYMWQCGAAMRRCGRGAEAALDNLGRLTKGTLLPGRDRG